MALRSGLTLAALTLALAGCAERELILPGERLTVRADLAAEGTAETAPAVAPPAARPVSLGPQTAGDWPQRAGNARHAMLHAALSAAPQRVFSVAIGRGNSRGNRIAAAPVVAQGRVFTMDALSTVSATSTAGAPLWQADLTPAFDRGGAVSGGGLAAEGGRLFAATGFGEVVALDVASGAVVWRQRIDAPGIGAPAVADGTVYVAGRDGSGWAISAAEGKVVWQVAGTPGAAGFLGAAAPTVGPRQVWFPTGSGDVMAVLRTGGGVKVWQSSLAGKRPGRAHALTPDVTGDPVLAGNTLYAGTAAGRTVALDAGTGDKLWTAGEGAMGPLALAGGALFVVTDEARLARIDAATGEVIWSVEMPYFEQEKPKRRKAITAHYGPVLAGGRVVVASSDGLLRGFDPASGALVHTAEIPGGAAAHPAVAGGTLFVAGTNGQLHAFR